MADPQTWRDPAGLDDEESVGGGNLVSARDLAIAGRALIADPWLSPISATPRYRFTAPSGVVHDALNHNKLVLGRYPGAIGGKTGYTKKAGNSLFASAQRGGRTMVAVVMDTKDAYGFTSSLFDRGFASSVQAQAGLERLPPLRLPTAAKIRPVATPPTAPLESLAPPVDVAAEPMTIAPDQPSRAAAPPLAVEPVAAAGPQDRPNLPLVAAGATMAIVAVVGGSRHRRRRRKRRYYQVPERRPAP
jgi:D-alanyl-D-alanine carboxypeptidase